MTRINTTLLKLEEVLKKYNLSRVIEKLIDYEDTFQSFDIDRTMLIMGFEENDVEAQQLIDTIELQQHYLSKNILTLKKALMIHENKLFRIENCIGVICQIGLN